VQHLIINGYPVDGSLSAVLSSCPNVINLAIQGHYENHALHVMSHPTHLTVASSCVQPHDKLPIQPHLNLTHLSIHGFNNAKTSWREWEFLAHLPKLTHICADNAIQDHIPTVLPLCPRLKLLVMVSFVSYLCNDDLPDLYLVDDNRLVLMVGQSYSTYALDWERGANGGVDLWIFAERVAFARSSACLFSFLVHLISFRVEILDREIFREAVSKGGSDGLRMGGISE